MKKPEKTRINVYLKVETMEAVRELSAKLGLSQSRVASLAVEMGITALQMSVNPDFQKFFDGVDIDDIQANRNKSPK